MGGLSLDFKVWGLRFGVHGATFGGFGLRGRCDTAARNQLLYSLLLEKEVVEKKMKAIILSEGI